MRSAPGDVLADVAYRDALLRHFRPSTVTEVGDDLMVDRHHFEVATGRLATDRTTLRDGQVRHHRFWIRLVSFTELHDWLDAAGFSSVEGFGDGGSPLTLESRRLIVRAVV